MYRQNTCYLAYNQCSSLVLLMVWRFINNSSLAKILTFIKKIFIYYASELRNFRIFTFTLKLLFFQYFVGTSDVLSVQMTCLSAYRYRQNSEKALWRGWGQLPLATLVFSLTTSSPYGPPPGHHLTAFKLAHDYRHPMR